MKFSEWLKITLLSICLSLITAVPAGAENITISAAMSLKTSFEEIGKAYNAKTGEKILFNFGASGDLARQIEGGAPVDVFASAAQKDMNSLQEKGMLAQGTRKNFSANAIALIIPIKSKLKITSFEDLKKTEVKLIAIGNPKTSPAGRYAEEVISYYKLTTALKDRLILSETVRQALDYTARGEVDAAIIFATDAAVRAADVKTAAIAPEQSHKPIVYPIAIVKSSKNTEKAKAFIDFVLSADGKKILEKHGFKTVK